MWLWLLMRTRMIVGGHVKALKLPTDQSGRSSGWQSSQENTCQSPVYMSCAVHCVATNTALSSKFTKRETIKPQKSTCYHLTRINFSWMNCESFFTLCSHRGVSHAAKRLFDSFYLWAFMAGGSMQRSLNACSSGMMEFACLTHDVQSAHSVTHNVHSVHAQYCSVQYEVFSVQQRHSVQIRIFSHSDHQDCKMHVRNLQHTFFVAQIKRQQQIRKNVDKYIECPKTNCTKLRPMDCAWKC